MMIFTFNSTIVPPTHSQVADYLFIFCQDKLLINHDDIELTIPLTTTIAQLALIPIRKHYLGNLDEHPCYAVEVEKPKQLPPAMAFRNLRALLDTIPKELFMVAGRALQILNWDKNHQFCGRCGEKMWLSETERTKFCKPCGLVNYPRIAPAVIVLISRGQHVLLSRSPHFLPNMYSVQAGFVEAGESLEEAVMREVFEEVGLKIRNLRYFGSQPWPFPHSLMIAFTAEYASGELTINKTELEDAGWYQADKLPRVLPSTMSIARSMIEHFLAKQPK